MAMTKEEIQRLMANDPQKLIDRGTEFQFEELLGTVKLINGWAAGGSWLEFEFTSGPFQGRKIWCAEGGAGKWFEYLADTSDDGFIFNPEVPCDDSVKGGGFYPEWHGANLTIKDLDDIQKMHAEMQKEVEG